MECSVHVVEEAVVTSPQAEDCHLSLSSQQMYTILCVVSWVLEMPLLLLVCLDNGLDFIV